MWGWTKLGAHAPSRTSVFKTATVFLLGEYGLSVLPSSLQSAIYRTSPFLESVATTWTTMMLAYNTQQLTKFLAVQPVRCLVWHSENLFHRSTLQFLQCLLLLLLLTHFLGSSDVLHVLDDAHLMECLHMFVSLISIGIITTSNQYSTESKIVGKYLSFHIIAKIPCIVSSHSDATCLV